MSYPMATAVSPLALFSVPMATAMADMARAVAAGVPQTPVERALTGASGAGASAGGASAGGGGIWTLRDGEFPHLFAKNLE